MLKKETQREDGIKVGSIKLTYLKTWVYKIFLSFEQNLAAITNTIELTGCLAVDQCRVFEMLCHLVFCEDFPPSS